MTPMDSPSDGALPLGGEEPHSELAAVPAPRYRWYHKMAAVLFITFCLEIGAFLLIFPWTEFWESNYFSSVLPFAQRHWDNMYVRGAISGLGVVNLYICFGEILRLRRFSRQ